MNYALAKQLKEAGFPQSGNSGYLEGNIETDEGGIITNNSVYDPSLEELIEACGVGWYGVIMNEGQFRAIPQQPVKGKLYFSGSTPSEAVAQLWLAINKK